MADTNGQIPQNYASIKLNSGNAAVSSALKMVDAKQKPLVEALGKIIEGYVKDLHSNASQDDKTRKVVDLIMKRTKAVLKQQSQTSLSKEQIASLNDTLINVINEMPDSSKSDSKQLTSIIVSAVYKVLEKTFVTNLVNKLDSEFKDTRKETNKQFDEVKKLINDQFKSMKIMSTLTMLFGLFQNTIIGKLKSLASMLNPMGFIRKIGSSISKLFGKALSKLNPMNFLRGIGSKFKSLTSALTDKLKGIGGSIKAGFAKVGGFFKNPFKGIMKLFGKGKAETQDEKVDEMYNILHFLFPKKLLKKFRNTLSKITDVIVAPIMAKIQGFIDNFIGIIASNTKKLIMSVCKAILQCVPMIAATVGTVLTAIFGQVVFWGAIIAILMQMILKPINELLVNLGIPRLINMLLDIFEPLKDVITEALRWILTTLLNVLKFFVSQIWPCFKIAIKWLYDTFMTLWDKIVKPVLDFFVDIFIALWDKVLQPVFNWLKDVFFAGWDLLVKLWNNTIKPFFDWYIKTLLSAINWIWDGLKSAWDWLYGAIKGIWDGLKNTWPFKYLFGSDNEGAEKSLSQKLSGALGSVKDKLSNLGSSIKDKFGSMKDKLLDSFSAVGNYVKDINFDEVFDKFNKFIENLPEYVEKMLPKILEAIEKVVTILWDKLVDWATKIYEKVKPKVLGFVDNIKEYFVKIKEKALQFVSKLKNVVVKIKNTIVKAFTSIRDTIVKLPGKLLNGIVSGLKKMLNVGKYVWANIKSHLPKWAGGDGGKSLADFDTIDATPEINVVDDNLMNVKSIQDSNNIDLDELNDKSEKAANRSAQNNAEFEKTVKDGFQLIMSTLAQMTTIDQGVYAQILSKLDQPQVVPMMLPSKNYANMANVENN